MVWCGSTEVYREAGEVHSTLEKFEKGLDASHPDILPSMIYAYCAIKAGIPYDNGAPNLSGDFPAMVELAKKTSTPIWARTSRPARRFMKTLLAPGFKARLLGMNGWYSTNILGNRDGEVLDDPESFKTKEVSKLGVLEHILQPQLYPDLYGKIHHVVRINYYPPRGDNKEGWDNIDIFGWLGYPMQIKVDFLCRDSILAAPIVLDLAIFSDLAKRAGMSGIQEWLSLLLQEPPDRSRALPRARHLHPADEAQEHPAPPEGRGADHAPRARVLRLAPRPFQQQRDERLAFPDLSPRHHRQRLVERERARLDALVGLRPRWNALEAGRAEEVHHLVAEARASSRRSRSARARRPAGRPLPRARGARRLRASRRDRGGRRAAPRRKSSTA